jgi:hypothetical protein
VPCVAPELAVYYWLERCYRVPRARRFAYAEPGRTSPLPRSSTDRMPAVTPLMEDEAIEIDMDEELDMADMLQLVDLDHSQVARDHTQYHGSKSGRSGLDMVERRPGTDTSPLPKYTLREPTPQAVPGASSAPAVITHAQPAGDAMPALVEPPPPLEIAPKMTVAEAEAAIAAAEQRDAVMAAVIAYMHGVFGGGLILIVKDELALGLRGFGGHLDETSVETIVLPLSAPSFFRTAYDTKRLFHGAPDEGHLQDRFFKLFDGDAPDQVLLVPVILRNRVVCLFYGHPRERVGIVDRHVAELRALAHGTEEAFVRLIRGSKKTQSD